MFFAHLVDLYCVLRLHYHHTLSVTLRIGAHPHLPYIEQVTLFAVNQVRIENQVAVSSVEIAIRLRIHRDKLQILDPPHL